MRDGADPARFFSASEDAQKRERLPSAPWPRSRSPGEMIANDPTRSSAAFVSDPTRRIGIFNTDRHRARPASEKRIPRRAPKPWVRACEARLRKPST